MPENIKTVVVEHTLTAEEQVCNKCGSQLEVIGKEIKQYLKIKPAEVYIQQDVYYTYACKNCEKNDIETPIVKTPQESPVIKGSFASPEAIAHIMTQKFVMYSPLYRQEQELKRQGVELTRQTMSNWLLKASKPGTAIGYLKNNEKYLRRYTKDRRLEIDNNRAERSIKPFVMGRKNFLFANTEC